MAAPPSRESAIFALTTGNSFLETLLGLGTYRLSFVFRLYIVAQWASWFSGHTGKFSPAPHLLKHQCHNLMLLLCVFAAVPLSARHPPELLEYYIKDCEANLLICSTELEPLLAPIAKKLGKPILFIDHDVVPEPDPDNGPVIKSDNVVQLHQKLIIEGAPDSKYYANSNAIILYTSGTTGRPKGVVLSHRNLDAQVTSLSNAWHIDDKDCVLHVLPLHHFHGVVNGLACPLNAGSKVIMLPQFESSSVWTYLLNVNLPMRDRISVFMAVPTIYALLIQEYDKIFASNLQMADYIKSHCKNKIRLMISGSAPLPETIFNKWESITGHKLLERYGMTEIGMGLSNPYIQDKTRDRRPGTVGGPLPFVEVKITEPGKPETVLVEQKGELDAGLWSKSDGPVFSGNSTATNEEPIIGDLFVRGKTVFSEYYKRPEETQKEFIDGWFKTGDTAAFVNGYFKILGRSSVDIIKSGGHKLSALEIESKLLEHPSIQDIAIVALPDETWGSKVAALVVLRENTTLEVADLKDWASQKLAAYAIPTVIKFVEFIPKNAMGKVNKKDLVKNAFVGAPVTTSAETTAASDPAKPSKDTK